MISKSVGVEAAFLESSEIVVEARGVGSEKVGGDADVGANTGTGMDFVGFAVEEEFAFGSAEGVLACGAAELEILDVRVLVVGGVARFAEAELESDLFASVGIEIETKSV